MKNGPHLAIGLCFILLGVALLLDRLGLFDVARALHFWPLALVLVGLGMIVQAMRRPGERSDFPVGAVFVLVLIGLFVGHAFEGRSAGARGADEGEVRVSAIFGGRRASVEHVFREAHVTALMGGTVLDLRRSTIPPGERAVVDVFTLMGGTVLHVPRDWVVDVQSTAIMGGVRDERGTSSRVRPGRGRGAAVEDEQVEDPESAPPATPPVSSDSVTSDPPIEREDSAAPAEPAGGAPRLIVRGLVLMGGLTLKP